jgi:anti-sigma regulatory factor (Ser/Thr protein kinase)
VSAGHPPPLVIEEGVARFLDSAKGPPLGAVAHPRYHETTTPLAPDAVIVLYTDGLVERRGRRIEEGMRALAERAAGAGPDPERICDALMEELVDARTLDDVALLVARTAAQASDLFELRLPATAPSLTAMRRALRHWLTENGATTNDVIDILIAVGEAAGNAVEHAYGPGDASFDVAATVAGEDVEVVVRDYGAWRPPRGHNRGRGTLLMQELMDGFEVRTTEHGTEVRLRRRIGAEGSG